MSAPAFPTPTSPFFTHQIWPSSVRQHSGDAQNQRMKKDAWIEMISQIHEGWIETMGVSRLPRVNGQVPRDQIAS